MYDRIVIGSMIHRNRARIAEAEAALVETDDLMRLANPSQFRALRRIARGLRRVRRQLRIISWVLSWLDTR